MKRLFLVLACTGLLAGMTSCKKNCICNISEGILSLDVNVGEMSSSDCKNLTSFSYAGVTVNVDETISCKPE